MSSGWKKLSSKVVHENPWFQVTEDDVTRADGSHAPYFVVRSKHGSVAVPFDGHKLYLVRQYRYPIQRLSWEFPSGGCPDGNFLHHAAVELREEAGITAKHWTELGEFAPTGGYSHEISHVFLAEDLEFGPHDREDSESDMIMRGFTPEEVEQMIARGEMFESFSIVPFYFFSLYQQGKL